MAGSQRFQQQSRYWVSLSLLLVAAIDSRLMAQQAEPRGPRSSRPQVEIVEPAAPDSTASLLDEIGQPGAGGRYDEPDPPPFDYWNPTWMPCQSLRTNRSLVLGHLWFGMDILGWSTKGVNAPPLVTAGSLASEGIIGQGNTQILFGNEFLHNEMRPGGRLTIGWWFDPNQYSGIEWHYFELDGQNIRFDAAADDANSFLARPITDALTGLPDAAPIASDTLTGSIQITSNLQLSSTGILFRDLFWASQFARIDYLVGYRHAHLYDSLRTDEQLTSLATGDRATIVDQFRAVNQFDGADLGLKGWWSPTGKLAVTGFAKVALGASNNNVIINGFSIDDSGTATRGGLLALPSNIGRRAHQEFGVVSEVGLGLEWQPICYWKFSLGYTWFYWSDVARAIDQIDTNVDVTQVCDCPGFRLQTTSFWAQGLNAGFSYQF
jgi:hypothetical protein